MSNFGSHNRRGGERFTAKPQSYEAVCANCGKSCTIPFKPTGERPVYCSECFETMGGGSGGRSSSGRRDSRGGGGGRSSRGGGSDRKEMFSAVCDDCGADCQVPFKPTGDKPIYCSDCYEKNGGKSAGRSSGGFGRSDSGGSSVYEERLNALDMKIERIKRVLEHLISPEIIDASEVDTKGSAAISDIPVAEKKVLMDILNPKKSLEDEELR